MDTASGGAPSSVIWQSQVDMERLAALRAAVEAYIETLNIQLEGLQQQLKDLQGLYDAQGMQITTQNEQLREQETVVLKLSQQVSYCFRERKRYGGLECMNLAEGMGFFGI